MGIQVSSSRTQRYGEALVRSGIVGKIREVHTFSNKSWGDDKPLPADTDPVPAPLDWDEWLGVSATRPFKKRCITLASGGAGSDSARARSATWAAISTARRTARSS